MAGLFLCNQESDELLRAMKPLWDEKVSLPISEKASFLSQDPEYASMQLTDIFPWTEELSGGIEHNEFAMSHLKQPDLFVRIRPGYTEVVMHKLQMQNTSYEFISPHTIRLPNGYNVDELFEVDREVVVQDLNSQKVGEFLHEATDQFNQRISFWDCCAASGGKSIMAKDVLGEIDLTVSDVRESILINLKKRFAIAGVVNYKSFVADLSTGAPRGKGRHLVENASYDFILADLPCTGSGTWGRTPEQLYFFEQSSIDTYSGLQKRICTNIIPYLKNSGKLLYVTCSVFKKENEDIVQFITNQFSLKLEKEQILKGYAKKADTMYAALFSRL
jgi:16S rRNA (cytosine967-C5)-methyltransferase